MGVNPDRKTRLVDGSPTADWWQPADDPHRYLRLRGWGATVDLIYGDHVAVVTLFDTWTGGHRTRWVDLGNAPEATDLGFVYDRLLRDFEPPVDTELEEARMRAFKAYRGPYEQVEAFDRALAAAKTPEECRRLVAGANARLDLLGLLEQYDKDTA